jgi:hypothetical protein
MHRIIRAHSVPHSVREYRAQQPHRAACRAIDANRATLEALVQYMAEQHLIAHPPAIEDLFVPSLKTR